MTSETTRSIGPAVATALALLLLPAAASPARGKDRECRDFSKLVEWSGGLRRETLTACRKPGEGWEVVGGARLTHVLMGDAAAKPDELGEVLLVRRGRAEPVKPGIELEPGDLLSSGPATLVVTFADGDIQLQVYPGTDLAIGNPFITLAYGELFAWIQEEAQAFFEVETEYGTASAERTRFDVAVRDGESVVWVFSGRVEVSGRAPETRPVTLEANQTAKLLPGRLIREPEAEVQRREEIRRRFKEIEKIIQVVPPGGLGVAHPVGGKLLDVPQETTEEALTALIDQMPRGVPKPRNATYDEKTLTPEQLQGCLGYRLKAVQLEPELAAMRERAQAEEQALQDEKERLTELWQATPPGDAEAVKRYKDKEVRYNASVSRFNDEVVASYNRASEPQRRWLELEKAECVGRYYYLDDMKLVIERMGLPASIVPD